MRTFDLVLGAAPYGRVAATAFLPDELQAEPPVIVLLPGGGVTRRYADLEIGGDASYSQARWLTARGAVVLALDTLGTGGSDAAVDVPGRADAEAAVDLAVRGLVAALRDGTLDPDVPPITPAALVGAGHSVGGHLVVGTQAAHGTFDAVAALGASMTRTRLALLPGRTPPFRAAPPGAALMSAAVDADLRANDHAPDVPEAVVASDGPEAPWRTDAPAFAAELLAPYASARQAAAVRVPVLLVYGEFDVTVEPLDDVAVFRSAPSVALTIVPGMAHSHNHAVVRETAWLRLLLFTQEVAAFRRAATDAAERISGGSGSADRPRYDLDAVPVEVLLDDEDAVAVLDTLLPGFTGQPMLRQARGLPFGRVLDLAGPQLGPDVVQLVRGRLDELR